MPAAQKIVFGEVMNAPRARMPGPAHIDEPADAVIRASWDRCVDEYCLDPVSNRPAHTLSPAEFKPAIESVQPILTLSREELDRLYSLVRPLGYATVVAAANGVIVERRCLDADVRGFIEHGVRPGAVWSEQYEGTNGVGTCVFEQQPVNVHRTQHFRRKHANLSCSAAPVFNPDGELMAVVDISSYATELADRSHALALTVVTEWARAVEERQFRERMRRRWVVALERGDGGSSAMLLALDAEHRIIGADRDARVAFELDEERLKEGVDLWSVFNRDPSVLRRKTSDDVATRLTKVGSDERWHGLITPPESASSTWRGSMDAMLHTRPRICLLASFREPTPTPVSRGGLSPGAYRRVREYIGANLDSNIGLDALAAEAGLSVYHFARAFKQTVGLPPHHYLLQQRIQRAAQLIESTDRPLSEIALSLGFSDQSHFAKHFSRFMGSTPSVFRRARR